MRLLSADVVRQAVPMLAAIDAVEAAFVQLSLGQATVPLRAHVPSPQMATSFFMPARLEASTSAPALGLKVVSVFPQNVARGEPSIYALVVLLNPETGQPLALLDGTYLTALRTGAASGVAARHLARPDARTLAVFGAGAQALPQVTAVCAVRPIERVWLVNRSVARAEQLGERLCAELPTLDLRVSDNAGVALAEADVVCTATASPTPLFADDALRAGTHINAVGSYKPSMAELPGPTVARARVWVDQLQAAWAEAGDLIQARDAGLIDAHHVVGELGALVAGRVPGRANADEITLFKSVGNAAQDLAVAALALARASELGLGDDVTL